MPSWNRSELNRRKPKHKIESVHYLSTPMGCMNICCCSIMHEYCIYFVDKCRSRFHSFICLFSFIHVVLIYIAYTDAFPLAKEYKSASTWPGEEVDEAYFREPFGTYYLGHKKKDSFHRTLAVRRSLSHRLRVLWVDFIQVYRCI